MATLIADTACVDPRAVLDDEVEVGPYCVVGPGVTLGRGTRLIAHVCLFEGTELGQRNTIWPFAVLGGDPAGPGDRTGVVVGDDTVIRESVTIHRGTARGAGPTRVGDRCELMAGVHLAHDVTVGRGVSVGQGATVGPDAWVGDGATIAPGVVVHSHVTIGEFSFVSGPSRVIHDVAPYMLADGHPAKVRCLNAVALKRSKTPRESIAALREAHRLLFRARMAPAPAEAILSAHGQLAPEVGRLLDFLRAQHAGRHGRARERAQA
jgi:UDP-N-acetylglucosamine acyltransferase